jgi:uncharacterized protein (DUF1697 family)
MFPHALPPGRQNRAMASTTALVALLRGVNVGGRAKLPMADLRAIVAGCGYGEVRTYIQSGNVVFTAAGRPKDTVVAQTLADALAAATPLQPEVVVRTGPQLAAVVDANPFVRRGEDPAHLHVTFGAGTAKAKVGIADLAGYAPEEAAAVGREVYLFLPGGLGRSRLAADLARRAGATGTTRNWRTVTRLAAMVAEVGAG